LKATTIQSITDILIYLLHNEPTRGEKLHA